MFLRNFKKTKTSKCNLESRFDKNNKKFIDSYIDKGTVEISKTFEEFDDIIYKTSCDNYFNNMIEWFYNPNMYTGNEILSTANNMLEEITQRQAFSYIVKRWILNEYELEKKVITQIHSKVYEEQVLPKLQTILEENFQIRYELICETLDGFIKDKAFLINFVNELGLTLNPNEFGFIMANS